ncbi:MAG: efflux RND transporter periplasmic adaptor subunit [Gammaproteobacteria bacterium]|jgi:membrane fusion protein (multidrug efflux system)|nr:efflux RND transporter periplasmic adaptor subunit [Gammaproteobacteria bacterium]MBT7797874.1 efflux RND transporter periplasmic adaptor subunit [Gammaproteobacteria bacterium]
MINRFIIVALSLGLVFGSIFGWKAYQQRQIAEQLAARGPSTVTVATAIATTETWAHKINTVGSLRAIQGVEVSAEVSGVVAEISFVSGSRVEAGAQLLELDDTAEAAELRSLDAQLELAKQDYERARGLSIKTLLSQAQLDRTKSVLDSLEARAEEQQALIARKSIQAPFSGELGIREINLGEYLSPGTPIVTLQQLDPIFTDFTVPERYLSSLAVDQIIEVEVAAFPAEVFQGKISAISPKVESRTRNIELQATLQNSDTRLRPGMFARVAVILGGANKVVTVPRTAVEFLPYGNSVFIVKEEGDALTVQRRQVTTGRTLGTRVEIIKGIKSGEQVVSAGQLKLRNGQHIQIDNSVELTGGATRG